MPEACPRSRVRASAHTVREPDGREPRPEAQHLIGARARVPVPEAHLPLHIQDEFHGPSVEVQTTAEGADPLGNSVPWCPPLRGLRP